MSNVPLGSGGTPPHANPFDPGAEYKKLAELLKGCAIEMVNASLIANAAPLSEETLRYIHAQQLKASDFNDLAGNAFMRLIDHFDLRQAKHASPIDPPMQMNLFVIPPAGPHSEGR